MQLAGELDTSGTTANDNHVQQTTDLLRRLVLESGGLDTVHDALANPLRITDLLQKAAVFLDTGDTESSVLSTDANDEHVECDLGLGSGALDLRIIVDVDNLFLVVDLGGLGLVVLDGGLLVTEEVADGFHNAAVFDSTGGAGREQRREEEVVARRDDDDIVVFRVELLEQGDRSPTSTCTPDLSASRPNRSINASRASDLPRTTRVFLLGSGSCWSIGLRFW